jgi:hypothetical protein
MLNFLPHGFLSIQLDIVGFLAILGEGSVERNAQTLGLAWHSKIPRLIPAPQALMKHERPERLPTTQGTVVGAYSGNVRHELNFFIRLMHKEGLAPFEVELVRVTTKKEIPKSLERKLRRYPINRQELAEYGFSFVNRFASNGSGKESEVIVKNVNTPEPSSYGPDGSGYLLSLTLVGAAMTAALIALSVVYNDGMSLLAVILLSLVSSILGIASQWEVVIPPVAANRGAEALPSSDVVIYYPNGSIRVIRCNEDISRLYFAAESCLYSWDDMPYRLMALLSTVMLMIGVVTLANATEILQVAYAAAYVILNVCYWLSSALNPVKHYWECAYEANVIAIKEPLVYDKMTTLLRRRATFSERLHGDTRVIFAHRANHGVREVEVPKRKFSRALWMAIALTGTSQWLNHSSHIGPMTRAWEQWHANAEAHAILPIQRTDVAPVELPAWDYDHELSELLKDAKGKEGQANFKAAATVVLAAHKIKKHHSHKSEVALSEDTARASGVAERSFG